MASWKQQALIEAPVAEVWDILCDPGRGPDWDEDLIAVTGAPTKIEKGSTFDVTGRGPLGLKATTTFKVEELEDLHELKMKCQFTGYYAHWLLTQAQDGTFTEVELGIEPVESKPSLSGKAAAALHTKSYLRREAEKLLDSLRARGHSRSRGRYIESCRDRRGPDQLDPHRFARELPDQRRAGLRPDRAQGAPPPTGR